MKWTKMSAGLYETETIGTGHFRADRQENPETGKMEWEATWVDSHGIATIDMCPTLAAAKDACEDEVSS